MQDQAAAVAERDDVADTRVARGDPVQPEHVAGAQHGAHGVRQLDVRSHAPRRRSRGGEERDDQCPGEESGHYLERASTVNVCVADLPCASFVSSRVAMSW